ncbi:glycosyl hydrolase 115 family protein [Galbibacter sp. EGI 63066]|uniref:glycosyl hydrolase 115 family protein n=1 Tax=Galbibacter sp. EGI 63066 TaxID=2993559 RepID=UPI0022488259|nr:glycosyl hydrolase 115 family protein [Galbibacter sp. EGI 63066]MCX2680245.1 glycosyl hydrolase 115 family protein [Galbibacter sp. EGI 63066]
MKFNLKYAFLFVFGVILFSCEGTSKKFSLETDTTTYVSTSEIQDGFPLATSEGIPPILVSSDDFSGVKKVAEHLQNDLKAITGTSPKLLNEIPEQADHIIIVGSLDESPLIKELIQSGKIKSEALQDKWEKHLITIVDNPFEGIGQALVIAGSDKRGTIYGMYDLSAEIGVNPWYYWADVPISKKEILYVKPGIHTRGEPKVKYRGIFINDEAPALTGWANEKFDGFNSQFYDKVFELILRMKGNYLWPAMWGKMFYVEDPKNADLADEYGIVMGTSHHEPLTRAHAEWEHFGEGEWDYNTNPDRLEKFWREGMERKGNTEALVTVGMRGDGDEPMTEGTAIELLENIVKKQREIITETTGKPAEETPQMWALYKEVQTYYDKGMQVPDDVTLLLCDDNWGNIRKLPELDASPRSGGYGIYYHFDYVGGPRNYKWINTTQIERVWEQMHLAYQYGVDKVWIVNVGDIKPMEFPIQFFLDYAWNPEEVTADNLQEYYKQWSGNTFGDHATEAIADIMRKYTKYNARRKPELIDSATYSLKYYKEADRIVTEYNALIEKAMEINEQLPEEYQDAYYQLVLFPVLASANVNELHIAAAKNHLYAKQGRASANFYAERIKELFKKDSLLMAEYHQLNNGKWNHMMSQTHIGYTYWQQPEQNNIPNTYTIELEDKAERGIAVEASEDNTLPTFSPFGEERYYIDIFNKGTQAFDFEISSENDWVQLSKEKGSITDEERIWVSIDWEKAPQGEASSTLIIKGNGKELPITVNTFNPKTDDIKGFVESNGVIVINADHFTREVPTPNPSPKERGVYQWKVIENMGKTGNSVISLPIEKGRVSLNKNSPKLSYDVYLFSKGKVKVHAYFSPTLNYSKRKSLLYGLSFDDNEPKAVTYNHDKMIENYSGSVPENWHQNVADNIKIVTTEFEIDQLGNHTLNYFRIDEGLVLQKLVIDCGGLQQTYLGPEESHKIN